MTKAKFISCLLSLLFASLVFADDHVPTIGMSVEQAQQASVGCMDCHTDTDSITMHQSEGVVLGCASCHGGKPEVRAEKLSPGTKAYEKAKNKAHILPKNKKLWKNSANPVRPFAKSMEESADFIRFVNPGDLRVAQQACGGCHNPTIDAVKSSLMSTTSMFWEGAAYNNGILPFKIAKLGESYSKDGVAQSIKNKSKLYTTEEKRERNIIEQLVPLPQWEVTEPGDVFRVFERGGLFINSQFPEIANPNLLEEPGKPDILSSNRGPGTGNRVSVPVLNLHKTRLNGPHLSHFGTNDNPGDYRSSGCTACHVVYGNDRNKISSGPYSEFGHDGKSQSKDPTIPKDEKGHPLFHKFTRAIPTSQCMVCHMHQPNMFVNSYLGFTMWDYESDAPFMWPEKQKYPSHDEVFKSLDRNPEEAAIRGKWSDPEFLSQVSEQNPKLKDTQFADYHGHGWNFRGIFKKDRKGNLLDKDGKAVSANDPEKFKKAVHMMDIHAEKGMHCSDCHFSQDSHGDGNIYGEVAHSVEIGCEDCHGTATAKANLKTSGPAAPKGGNDLSLQRTAFGKPRFEWLNDVLYQYSSVDPKLKWEVRQVLDSVTPGNSHYNSKSAKAKLQKRNDGSFAHDNKDMSCFTCHSSWVTSCGGCHLPIKANWKQKSKHYDGKETRNWASYNPQVVRDEMFQIGRHGPGKGNKIVPVRSSSALVLSSEDINRQKIYVQQPPISSPGYSSQAFAPHFPHTVRTVETKTCSDCHLSKNNDNNAIMAQLMLLGTNFVNFMGYHTYIATGDKGLEAVQVTEWDEPQAVIGSYLHKYAYPDWYKKHADNNLELKTSHTHHGVGGVTNTIQLRGEYLFTSAGSAGFRIYDVANIANKGFSERIVTSPFSPLGQDTHISTKNATSFALPTNMPIAPFRKTSAENQEQQMHEIYHYAVIADSEEGLILVNVDTLADRDRTNNFIERALTWNQDEVLSNARHVQLAGHHAFFLTDRELVVIDLDKPLEPKVLARLRLNQPTAIAIQFRYAFVTDADGMHTIDITDHAQPKLIQESLIPLAEARNVYVARTYAYLAAGREGLVIVDVENPEKPKIYARYQEGVDDLNDVKVATTNASLFAYLADGKNGLKILQLTDPERVPTFYGFSPEVKPKLIAHKSTDGPALAISKPLDRDRAVDETGQQVSIFGRIGSRPLNHNEMERLYKKQDGEIYKVE